MPALRNPAARIQTIKNTLRETCARLPNLLGNQPEPPDIANPNSTHLLLFIQAETRAKKHLVSLEHTLTTFQRLGSEWACLQGDDAPTEEFTNFSDEVQLSDLRAELENAIANATTIYNELIASRAALEREHVVATSPHPTTTHYSERTRRRGNYGT